MHRKGIWHAVGAYVAWGLLPIYWKWLQAIPATQIIGHRVLWSCVFLGGVILFSRQGGAFRTAVFSRRVLLLHAAAALLISVNWLTYIWAVEAGHIVETSLGYFMNPLISVLFGVLFLRERLRRWQWAAVALAATGMLYLTVTHGSPPWIALALALSFGLYGLVKKRASLGSVHGLALETGLLLPLAALYLLHLENHGRGAFLHGGMATDALLAGTGLVTTAPLLLFASAARRIPLWSLGVLQYIAPTLQLLIGVLIYREPFTPEKFIGFGMVWAALVIFGIEGFFTYRARVN